MGSSDKCPWKLLVLLWPVVHCILSSVIERIARIREPALSPAAIIYTRHVTMVWSVFFVLNGAVALYTAVATPLKTWALYNGFIAYLLIGALFLAELAVRSLLRTRRAL